MTKRILIFMVTAMMLSIAPVVMAQDVQKTSIEAEQPAVTITVTESTLHLKNAAQQVLEVYNLAGVKVLTQKIDSNDKAIELNSLPKGCYIIKVGNTARKVYIR